jgi:Icc-related predicted phosphoesterase
MRQLSSTACILALVGATATLPARADDDSTEEHIPPQKTYDEFQDAYELACPGAPDVKLTAPTEYDLNGFHYVITGGRAMVTRLKPRGHADVRLGVINATKDAAAETLANVDDYLAKFKAADVDAILVGGDTAFAEDDIQTVLTHIATAGYPVLVVIGNSEPRSGFNRAVRATWADNHNVINADLVRTYDGDGFHVVSLPGYYDKRFAGNVAPCLYSGDDLRTLGHLLTNAPAPTVLLTHGPPRQSGKSGLDYAPQAGNVGDEEMADVLARAKLSFGIFGHILEAGGRATDATGKHEIKQGAWSDTLFLNPGSANSAPWPMNSGAASYGMAALLTLEGNKAKYEIIRSPQRVGR